MELIIFIFCAFFAAIFATLAGFGSSTLLIPVSLFFWDVKTAVFLVASFHLFNNIFKVKLFFTKIDYNTAIFFGLSSITAAFLGALSIDYVPHSLIKKFIAVFLICFSIFSILNPHISVSNNRKNQLMGGFISGFAAGLIGMGGALRSMFLITMIAEKQVYIATSALIAMFVDLTRIPTYLITGIETKSANFALVLVLLIAAAYGGVKTGKSFLGKIEQEKFRKFVFAVLAVMGVTLLFV